MYIRKTRLRLVVKFTIMTDEITLNLREEKEKNCSAVHFS